MNRWIAILALLFLASLGESKTDVAIFLTGMFILLGTQPESRNDRLA